MSAQSSKKKRVSGSVNLACPDWLMLAGLAKVVSEPAVKTGTQDKEGIQTPVASTQGLEVP